MIFCTKSGQMQPCTIDTGINLLRIMKLQNDWHSYRSNLLSDLITQHPTILSDDLLAEKVISENNLSDFHWDWNSKVLQRDNSNYQWFFLEKDNLTQGVCIIYFPQESGLDAEKIFYVDYLATAYWNRKRPNYQPTYSGVGKMLINYAINYSIKTLGYRPGFCLHSLPGAETFYNHLGMTDLGPDKNKQGLRVFEATMQVAAKLGGISNAA